MPIKLLRNTQTGAITLKSGEIDKSCLFNVIDTGLGLPEQARARTGGAGLRLAISQEVICRHGRMIELLKSDENGTCFRVLLQKGPLSD